MNLTKSLKELEEKLKLRSDLCPYCDNLMESGYTYAGYPLFWAPSLIAFKRRKRISGIIPSAISLLKYDSYGITIDQFD
jgi:hypothetical protein